MMIMWVTARKEHKQSSSFVIEPATPRCSPSDGVGVHTEPHFFRHVLAITRHVHGPQQLLQGGMNAARWWLAVLPYIQQAASETTGLQKETCPMRMDAGRVLLRPPTGTAKRQGDT